MQRVRVLVADMPLFLRSVIQEMLSGVPDVELLDSRSDARHLDSSGVDVVLAGTADPHDFGSAATLLERWPRSRILLVGYSGRQAAMYELYPRKLVLGDLSVYALEHAIRAGFSLTVM